MFMFSLILPRVLSEPPELCQFFLVTLPDSHNFPRYFPIFLVPLTFPFWHVSPVVSLVSLQFLPVFPCYPWYSPPFSDVCLKYVLVLLMFLVFSLISLNFSSFLRHSCFLPVSPYLSWNFLHLLVAPYTALLFPWFFLDTAVAFLYLPLLSELVSTKKPKNMHDSLLLCAAFLSLAEELCETLYPEMVIGEKEKGMTSQVHPRSFLMMKCLEEQDFSPTEHDHDSGISTVHSPDGPKSSSPSSNMFHGR